MEKRICAKCGELVTSKMEDEMAMVEYEGNFYHRDCLPDGISACETCGAATDNSIYGECSTCHAESLELRASDEFDYKLAKGIISVSRF